MYPNFLESQGYDILKHIFYQDNNSTTLLGNNGPKSVGKDSQHFSVTFFVTYVVERVKLTIENCMTLAMSDDFITKPLQGTKLLEFRTEILGM